ncbi:MAG: 2-oxoacid:acceptor oxidoreductase family protein [Thermoprotei archaeon]|nr:2-oxoacid:acceptor oxidoreductase family protein [Thermoprotei archaeon]
MLNPQRAIEVRFHGRGGQGAVTASIILAEAAALQGLYSQAFPEFGPERRGAPVKAYTRISKGPIKTRAPILNPEVVVVLDPSLHPSIYMQGLKSDGLLILNSKREARVIAGELGFGRVAVVDATGIALRNLKAPIVNVAMLGALARVLEEVSLDSIAKATLKALFNIKWEGDLASLLKTSIIGEAALGNIKALNEAYRLTEVYVA